ncbi:MAG: cellulase N-terminal Ig-like domain-containing protein, partial [Verrucomicrobiia bacterium]
MILPALSVFLPLGLILLSSPVSVQGEATTEQATNLAINGDMEEADGEVPRGWGDTWQADGANLKVSRDTSEAKVGSASLRLRIDSPEDALANVTARLPGLVGGEYMVSGWIKARPDAPGSLFTGIGRWGGGFAWIDRIGHVQEAFDWRRFEKRVSLPSDSRLQVMMRGKGTVWLDGISVAPVPRDLTPVARTEDSPRVAHVAAVSDDMLAVIVVEGRVIPNEHKLYEPQPGDKIVERKRGVDLERGRGAIGWLVGAQKSHLTTHEGFVGDRLQADLSEEPSVYTIRSGDKEFQPAGVWRKSRPLDASSPGWNVVFEHTLLLQLPEKLREGQTYTIDFGPLNTLQPAFEYTHQPSLVRSPAVHVNQIGYHPLDQGKQAYLSFWTGVGPQIYYPKDLEFRVVEDESGREAFRGKVELSWPANKPERMQKDRNNVKADVHRMDFSALTRPGRYRVVVDGIGTSYPFVIGEDAWKEAFKVSMRGMLHHRSGIALGPPHTDYIRPRGFHPDDEHVTV